MNRFFGVLILIFAAATMIAAQKQTDYYKGEISTGYVMEIQPEGDVSHGGKFSGVYNFYRNAGVKFNVSYTQTQSGYSTTNVNAGIQVKNNSKSANSRLKPFGHFLAGYGENSFYTYGKGTLLAIGGGLDIRVSKTVDIRAFEYDINIIISKNATVVSHQFSAGIVFKF